MNGRLEDNRTLWDALVRAHVGSAFYDLRGFLAGADPLSPLEHEALGSVVGQSILHLMCHFGVDTLALARQGARVTGVDFSPEAIEVARKITVFAGLEARFIETEVTRAATVLDGERFDRVFTSWGVTCWLADLDAWAATIAACLRPGGSFHLLEVHPLAWVFLDPNDVSRVCTTPQQPYETRGASLSQPVQASYGSDIAVEGTQHLWHHGVGSLITALVGAGLVVEAVIERDVVTTQVLPALVQRADGLWTWPEGIPSLPLSLEIRARLPA